MSDSPLFVPDRHSGRKLGKYEVLCRLSTGGMSEILLAYAKGMAGFRKLVVLKQILPDIQSEQDIVRMFLDEAKITAAFSHPNIAQVFDLDLDDGELFLAMEFVQGATLIEVAKACRNVDEPIPIGFTLAAVRDTALALHYAHTFKDVAGRSRTVIHRDVAEKNIMVTFEGTTKLLDFGIAKVKDRVSRTAVGKVKGTSGYMSPEQIMGLDLDARSDVFSLGVVLHECLTGMRLFYGKDAEEGMRAALDSDAPPPSQLNPALGPELDRITMRALARDREARYGTALEFARAIERTVGSEIWYPEQSAEFVHRFFSDRLEQTRRLLNSTATEDMTGEIFLPRPSTPARSRAQSSSDANRAPTDTGESNRPSVLIPAPPRSRARPMPPQEEERTVISREHRSGSHPVRPRHSETTAEVVTASGVQTDPTGRGDVEDARDTASTSAVHPSPAQSLSPWAIAAGVGTVAALLAVLARLLHVI